MNCKMSIYLAYGMLSYIFATIFYLINTINIGTPFKDSLTQEQKEIKKKSAKIRGKIFYVGIIIGIVFCMIIRPFKKC